LLLLRVGVAEGVPQSFTREFHHEAMLFSGIDTDPGPFDRGEGCVQGAAQLLVFFRGNPARPSVYDEPALQGREVPPGDQVVRPHIHVHSQCFQDAAPQLIGGGIITEESQMGRTAPRRYSHGDRIGQAADPARGQAVEMGSGGRLQGRPPVLGQVP
jgi:hypothetical protein